MTFKITSYKLFTIVNSVAVLLSSLYYSVLLKVDICYGGSFARRFNDPTEMNDFLYNAFDGTLWTGAWVLACTLFIPASLLLMLYNTIIKRQMDFNAALFCVLNAICFYVCTFCNVGATYWLFD